MDLIVRRAQLQDRPSGEWVDIGIAGGLIDAIAPHIEADVPVFDAGGRLTCAGLVETHIHLDKSRLLYVEAFKPGISEADIYERAEATLRECLLHGTTRIRTHVEIDPKIGLRGYDALARLARDYAWAVDLQLCFFPQDGLTNVPGTDELLVETLERGVRVIGGAPRYDTDAPAQTPCPSTATTRRTSCAMAENRSGG